MLDENVEVLRGHQNDEETVDGQETSEAALLAVLSLAKEKLLNSLLASGKVGVVDET